MNRYQFYYKNDPNKEAIAIILSTSRLNAAKYFARGKRLSLKEFLTIYAITR